MGRPERLLDPENGPVERFARELRGLREAAGRPSYRELAKRAHYSVTALAEAAGGGSLPSLAVALAYATACGGDRAEWEARWRAAADELAADRNPSDDLAKAPYQGLEPFEPEDASWFFGRQRLVDELVERLRRAPFLAVFGPTGSGKSSLLRAGLLPVLNCDAGATVVLLTPGEHPLEELAVGLAEISGGSARVVREDLRADPASIKLTLRQASARKFKTACVVLVVDQFEEIFTLCRDEEERRCFVDGLLAAASAGRHGGRVVIGMRADFYARCAEHPALVKALRDRQLLVGPMEESDLRDVVTGPAKQAGLKAETALVEAVVNDALGEPGALPLVSHALLETWKRRRGTVLTLAGYRDAGGIQGGIAQTAESLYGEFGPAEQQIVKEVFVRLTALGEGTEDTRRRVRTAELAVGAGVVAVLDRLATARLVTVGHDEVQVAHEAVIRHWPRLRGWLAEDRDLLRARQRLTEAAVEWDQHGREDGSLYRGARLASWETRDLEWLNDLERAFLAASRARLARERAVGRRRIRLTVGGLASAVTVVSVLAAVALVQSATMADQRDVAVSRQLAASARGQLELDPELAVLLAREAWQTAPTVQAADVLRQATLESRIRRTLFLQRYGKARGVTYSPDGRRLAVSSGDGSVRIWDLRDGGDPIVLSGFRDEVLTPVFSRDGRYLAAAGIDETVRIWDWSAGAAPTVLRGHRGQVLSVAFSPDGRRLASAGDDGTVRVWDRVRGDPPVILHAHRNRALSVAFTPDGRRLVSGGGDGAVRLWNWAERGDPVVLRGHEGAVEMVAVSPDGRNAASASTDGTARVWDLTGRGAPRLLRGHDGTVEGVTFSPAGRRVMTTGNDGTVRVWNPAFPVDPVILRGHDGTVWSGAFAPDGRTLTSVGDDGTARSWDVTGIGDPVVLHGHTGPVWDAAITRDGRRVASASQDGTVRVWNADGTGDPVVLKGPGGEMLGVAISPDGRLVAGAGLDGVVLVWRADGTQQPVLLRGHEGAVFNVAFSPDGRRLVSAGADGTARIWNLTTAERPSVLSGHKDFVRYVTFSPDGRQVASAGLDGTVRLWDAAARRAPVVLRGHQGLVFALAYSPDGRRLASAGNDGTARIWNADGTGEAEILHGHQGLVWGVAFNSDGRFLATTGNDHSTRVWTVGGGEPVVFRGHAATVEAVRFAPDGRLLTTHGDGTVRIWRCDVCAPIEQVLALASQRVTRPLSPAERERHTGDPR